MRVGVIPVWAGLLMTAQPAAAQLGDAGSGTGVPVGGALPGYGAGTTVNNLRPQLERYLQVAQLPATAPAFVLTPSIGVDLGFTDNANRGYGGSGGRSDRKQADVFTILSPTIQVTQDSARIKSSLNYSPNVELYASTGNQNRVSNFFSGQSLVTLARDALFLDLRGSITQSSLLGTGFNDGSTRTYSNQNQVQTTAFSVTPYAEHRFGGWGTGRIGYSFARTLQDTNNNNFADGSTPTFDVFGNPVYGTQGYGSIGNLSTQRERASFATGENLGRFNNITVLEAIQYAGSGYSGSHRNQALNELGYALTRQVTLLGGIGYQDILYTGGGRAFPSNAVRVNEPTWNVGTRYSPNPDSTVTVTYGRRDGSSSVTLDGQYAPTPRTRVYARYSTGITSDLENAQSVLDTTSVGPTGLVTDSVTGAPVSSGSQFGSQNGIYRAKRASVTGLLLANRDSYYVTFGTEDRTTLTNTASVYTGTVIPSGTSSSNYYVSGSWQHELASDMSSSLSVQYGSSNNTSQLLGLNGSRQDTVTASASVVRTFTATLSGNVRYVHTERFGGNANQASRAFSNNFSENTILVGLRKGF